MLTFPDIDPVAFTLGPVQIRWYGISYVVGILLAWMYARYLVKRYSHGILRKDLDDFVIWATIGVVAGGRLGEVLFYQPAEFMTHPWEILYLWEPGMSFHGGLIGVAVATVWFCAKRNIPFLSLADIVACGAPIGLFFGRLANFVNAELYGRVTDVSWGMVFPNGGPLPRHPSQLYEAFLEGIVLFFGLMVIEHVTKIRRTNPGFLFGLFLIGYGLARIIVENFREPDEGLGFFFWGTTMGQWLSVPVLLAGVLVMFYSVKHRRIQ
jgi:phosphatidylglycerol---prolipoprotein diacylglyceryl transferase